MIEVYIQARDGEKRLASVSTKYMPRRIFGVIRSLLDYLACLQDGRQIALCSILRGDENEPEDALAV
jgi:hypothetical protein